MTKNGNCEFGGLLRVIFATAVDKRSGTASSRLQLPTLLIASTEAIRQATPRARKVLFGEGNLRLGLSQPYISLMRRYATDNSRHNHPLRRKAALKLAGRALSPSVSRLLAKGKLRDLRPHRYSSAATCHSTRSPQSNESEHLARLVKLVQISTLRHLTSM
jgi:hypothetical protein